MISPDYEVVVIGAGLAGLAAVAELDKAGYRVLCLEARERIGGRILTVRDELCPIPVEMGAEFIHGRPPELWQIIHSGRLSVYDCVDTAVHIKDGKLQQREDAWLPVAKVMHNMRKAAEQGPDQSFAAFLQSSSYSKDAKELSASFVEGFNAARKEIIGIASLAEDARASDSIDGNRSFRFLSGYDSVPLHIFKMISEPESKFQFNAVVAGITWSTGSVNLRIVSAVTGGIQNITARRLVVTVPLGVLQAKPGEPGFIDWNPAPDRALSAAAALAFGQVFRVVTRFSHAFWEENDAFASVGFLLSNELLFPTWWTPLAVRVPILTGWSAGPHADALLHSPRAEVITQAIRSLARITGTSLDRVGRHLEHAYFWDWHADPFSRGAYSYVPVGALSARQTLAEPIEDTLYFAGEATELNGHSATTHGAIASGIRAAQQIIASSRLISEPLKLSREA